VLDNWGSIGVLIIIALVFPAGALITSWGLKYARIRPNVPSDPVKEDTYECGLRTEGPSRVQFNFRFYAIALSFVILDVEIIFLFPWALVYDSFGWVGYFKGISFIGILLVGIVSAWRKGALEWRS